MTRKLALIVTAAGAAISPAAAQQFWTVGAGYLSSSISNNGAVVGDNNGTGQYFLWTADNGPTDIGGQVAGNGVGGTAGISYDGSYVGGTMFNTASGFHEMGRYSVSTGSWTALGGLGASSDGEISSGWGISGDGNSVVGLGWIPGGGAHATRWTDGQGMNDLGSTVAGRSSRANAANLDASVVVGWQDGAGRQGAVWVNGVQQLIFDNGGAVVNEAYTVSGNGEWVSGIDVAGFVGTASLWRYNTVTQSYEDLGNLATGGQSRAGGNAINADGTLIAGGTWGIGPATFGTAIIWQDGVGVTRFSDYLDNLGVAYDAGFQFAFVSDMSEDGTWFTGWGRDSTNQLTSFVINVPAPSALPVLAMGGLFAARRRRG